MPSFFKELLGGGDINRAPMTPTSNWRMQAEHGNSLYAVHKYAVRNASLQGYGGRVNLPAKDRLAGPRGGKNHADIDKDVFGGLSRGGANMAVGAIETAGIRAGLVAAGVATGPAGWIALGASFFLPKIF